MCLEPSIQLLGADRHRVSEQLVGQVLHLLLHRRYRDRELVGSSLRVCLVFSIVFVVLLRGVLSFVC